MRFRRWASAVLMAATGVPGLATKNAASGTDVPASLPLAQDGPDEPCWTAGTNTWSVPWESVYRKGSSAVTGLAGRTMFHRPCGHQFAPPIWLLRTMYCWLP